MTYNVIGDDLTLICGLFEQLADLVELHECRARQIRRWRTRDQQAQQDLERSELDVRNSTQQRALTAHARACDHRRFIRAVMPGAVLYADCTAFKIRHAER